MTYYVPEFEKIDKAWFEVWGNTFNAPEIVHSMLGNERLRRRVTEQMLHKSEVDLNAVFSDIEITVLSTFENDRKRLRSIAGLVFHGRIIREQVQKSGFEKLTRKFRFPDLKLAAGLRELHSDHAAFNPDLSRLDELVDRAGQQCLEQWRLGLNRQMQLRVDLIKKPDLVQPMMSSDVGIEHASAIVNAVCLRLNVQV